ncbi:MAG TPA: Scr1 family TA system antitoxin-like transcriptional regulator, partial [Streptosporangiaceae bacterium]
VAANTGITIRVIPFQADAHIGLVGPFTLMEFDGGLPDLLYLDSGQGELATISVNDPLVSEYADRFETLLNFSLPEAQSIELIRAAAEQML